MVYINISNINNNKKIKKILDEHSIKYTENLSKRSKICIIDYNINEIEDLSLSKKIVLVLMKNNKKAFKEENRNILYLPNVYTFYKVNELFKILKTLISKEKKIKKWKKVGFACFSVLIIVFSLLLIRKGTPINVKASKVKEDSILEKTVDYTKENIVLLGDSITDFYNVETFYGDLPIINSGTSGFQTPDIIKHLKDYVYIYNPTKIFLLIGTNDIAFTDITNEELIDNFDIIINEIKKNRPNSKLYIESIYPINRNTDNDVVIDWMVGNRDNNRIKKINKMLKELCKKRNVTYIDMYDNLIDENGDLKLEYTIDGLHISHEGYKVITKIIMGYIDSSSIE